MATDLILKKRSSVVHSDDRCEVVRHQSANVAGAFIQKGPFVARVPVHGGGLAHRYMNIRIIRPFPNTVGHGSPFPG